MPAREPLKFDIADAVGIIFRTRGPPSKMQPQVPSSPTPVLAMQTRMAAKSSVPAADLGARSCSSNGGYPCPAASKLTGRTVPLITWHWKNFHQPQSFGTSTLCARCLNSRPGISPVA